MYILNTHTHTHKKKNNTVSNNQQQTDVVRSSFRRLFNIRKRLKQDYTGSDISYLIFHLYLNANVEIVLDNKFINRELKNMTNIANKYILEFVRR